MLSNIRSASLSLCGVRRERGEGEREREGEREKGKRKERERRLHFYKTYSTVHCITP